MDRVSTQHHKEKDATAVYPVSGEKAGAKTGTNSDVLSTEESALSPGFSGPYASLKAGRVHIAADSDTALSPTSCLKESLRTGQSDQWTSP